MVSATFHIDLNNCFVFFSNEEPFWFLEVVAVSIPGRLDGQQDDAMRKGDMNPKTNSSKPQEGDPLIKGANESSYTLNRSRTLVNPSGCKKFYFVL
jgi:hypothetical protein